MDGNKKEKASLSKEAILRAAVGLADESGLDALTIRQLAHVLGTAPTTIYHHLKSKGEIIDGMVEFVFSEIEVPSHHGSRGAAPSATRFDTSTRLPSGSWK